jgi:hypothetical protein
MFFSAKTYEILKWMCLIVLPAFSTAIFTLGEIWGWDNAPLVVGSIGAFNTLLGATLGFSTASYNTSDAKFDGTIDANLNVSMHEVVIDGKDKVLLKVESSMPERGQGKHALE